MQTDLANTLLAIAQNGPQAFYEGDIAQKIAAAVQAAGGVMTADDLKAYRAIERTPVRGTYRGYDIVSMPPPSSGGVVLIEMLNILEGYDLAHADQTQALFLIIEAMKRAYADRAYLSRRSGRGESAGRAADLQELRRRVARHHRSGARHRGEGYPSDRDAGAIRRPQHHALLGRSTASATPSSNTYTLNFSYGVGLVAAGTGILLNNELDDFAAKPDAPNAYGLLGFEANAPGPGKRPLSSMTPTIVLKDGKPFLVTGSPGGSRIISTVLQVVVNVIDRGMDIAAAVSAPRVHHQWMPDLVFAEPGFPDDVDRGTGGARRCGDGAQDVTLGQLDPGHAGRLCRRRRSAHPRRAGGGVLMMIACHSAKRARRLIPPSSELDAQVSCRLESQV